MPGSGHGADRTEIVDLRSVLHDISKRPHILQTAHVDDACRLLTAAGFEVIVVDASTCVNERDAARVIGNAMNFPDYFQPNWDAFSDSLGECPPRFPAAVVVVGVDAILEASVPGFVRVAHMLTVLSDEYRSVGEQIEFIFVRS